MSTDIVEKPKTVYELAAHNLDRMTDKMEALLSGSGISAEKFRYMAIQQLTTKPELAKAAANNLPSFIASVMQAAEQGLDFSRPNEAHLVALPDGVHLWRGYKGIAKMAKRNQRIAGIDVQAVYTNDVYEREAGSNSFIVHRAPPIGEDRGPLIGFYAIAFQRGAPPIWDEMSVVEVERHAKRFIKANKGAFAAVKTNGRAADNFIAYGLKTVLIRLCYRKLDLSSELGEALKQEFAEEVEAQTPEEPDGLAQLVAAKKREMLGEAPTPVTMPGEDSRDGIDLEY